MSTEEILNEMYKELKQSIAQVGISTGKSIKYANISGAHWDRWFLRDDEIMVKFIFIDLWIN